MRCLKAFMEPRLRLIEQAREIAALRAELVQLRAQVESMKTGMRRCISCDYRIAFRAQDRAADSITSAPAPASPPAGSP